MRLEDERSKLMRVYEMYSIQNSKMQKQIRLDQMKLSDDIKEFLYIREHFDHYRQQRVS